MKKFQSKSFGTLNHALKRHQTFFSSPIRDASLYANYGDARNILHSEVEQSDLFKSGFEKWYDLANATKDPEKKVMYYTETIKQNKDSFYAFCNRAKALIILGDY